MFNYCYDKDPLLAACGISIEKQLTKFEGRVLEAPKVYFVSPVVFMFLLSIIGFVYALTFVFHANCS